MFGKDKALLTSVLAGGVWNGFLLERVKGQDVPCRFFGGAENDGHLFWDCPFPPLDEIRDHPEFHDLMELDKSSWPRCLLWHGWLLLLSGVNGGSPWAENADEGAGNRQLPVEFDVEGAAERVAAQPDVWTDGSLVEDKVSGAASSGSGFLLVVLVIFGQIVGGPS